ncbi:MAG: nitroreductase family protein [Thermomicrobiales bacterium]|nr:nitroreductase family protein [Thermomicrobiales bacterium]
MAKPHGSNEITHTLLNIRQTRQYTGGDVSDEIVNELLEVARWTGSSRNTQPWHFVAVTDKDILAQLGALRTPINWVSETSFGIAIVLDGDAELSEAYDEGRVTERLMIGAQALGLHSGVAWFGDDAQQAEAKRIMNIPEKMTARSLVAIGTATTSKDPRPNPAQGGRHPLSEVASFNRMSD